MIDDIIDQGVYRRGKPCIHTLEDVGNLAARFPLIHSKLAYELIRDMFPEERHVNEIIGTIEKSIFYGCMGAGLEEVGVLDFERVNFRWYHFVSSLKTGHWVAVVPAAVAMLMVRHFW